MSDAQRSGTGTMFGPYRPATVEELHTWWDAYGWPAHPSP